MLNGFCRMLNFLLLIVEFLLLNVEFLLLNVEFLLLNTEIYDWLNLLQTACHNSDNDAERLSCICSS